MWLYTALMVIAVAVGAAIARRTQGHLPLSARERLWIGFAAFCGAMMGAKLPFVLSDGPGLLSGAAWLSDGKTILLGLAGGYAGVEVAKWSLDIRVRTGDSFVVPVAAAIAIGRVGCFVGGCCYGTPTQLPWGIVFPHVDLQPRHPTQLYEAAFHALVAVGMAMAWRRGRCPGQLFKIYILLYAAYRFGTEFIRPEARGLAGLTAYQWASLALVTGFGWLWWQDTVRLRRASGHNGSPPTAAPG